MTGARPDTGPGVPGAHARFLRVRWDAEAQNSDDLPRHAARKRRCQLSFTDAARTLQRAPLGQRRRASRSRERPEGRSGGREGTPSPPPPRGEAHSRTLGGGAPATGTRRALARTHTGCGGDRRLSLERPGAEARAGECAPVGATRSAGAAAATPQGRSDTPGPRGAAAQPPSTTVTKSTRGPATSPGNPEAPGGRAAQLSRP